MTFGVAVSVPERLAEAVYEGPWVVYKGHPRKCLSRKARREPERTAVYRLYLAVRIQTLPPSPVRAFGRAFVVLPDLRRNVRRPVGNRATLWCPAAGGTYGDSPAAAPREWARDVDSGTITCALPARLHCANRGDGAARALPRPRERGIPTAVFHGRGNSGDGRRRRVPRTVRATHRTATERPRREEGERRCPELRRSAREGPVAVRVGARLAAGRARRGRPATGGGPAPPRRPRNRVPRTCGTALRR